MTAAVPGRRRPAPDPCLTTTPNAGVVIGALFALAVLLFVVGLITL